MNLFESVLKILKGLEKIMIRNFSQGFLPQPGDYGRWSPIEDLKWSEALSIRSTSNSY
jgi:hypothetical protein